MGRQLRSKRAGESVPFVKVVPQTTVAKTSVVHIDNYGVTNLTQTTTGVFTYVLGAPLEGVWKTLVDQSATSEGSIVRGSTGTSVTFGTTAATQITFNSTKQSVVQLLGVNSTRWAVVSVYPDNVAANTTGTVIGTS